MSTYQMEIVEIHTHTFLVNAESEEAAKEAANSAYFDNDLEQFEDYFVDVELHDITVLGLDN